MEQWVDVGLVEIKKDLSVCVSHARKAGSPGTTQEVPKEKKEEEEEDRWGGTSQMNTPLAYIYSVLRNRLSSPQAPPARFEKKLTCRPIFMLLIEINGSFLFR